MAVEIEWQQERILVLQFIGMASAAETRAQIDTSLSSAPTENQPVHIVADLSEMMLPANSTRTLKSSFLNMMPPLLDDVVGTIVFVLPFDHILRDWLDDHYNNSAQIAFEPGKAEAIERLSSLLSG